MYNLCVIRVAVVLTAPIRWPALREHTKVPLSSNMVLMQDGGALS